MIGIRSGLKPDVFSSSKGKEKLTMRKIAAMVAVLAGTVSCGPGDRARQTSERERAEARLARGRYLLEGLSDCFGCHSEIDWKAPGAPALPGRKGVGAVVPDESIPFQVVAPNITPDAETGLGKWTDQEIGRALRNGIGHDGRVLFPLMPYMLYRDMSDEDLAATIAYLRSLAAVRNATPKMLLPEPVQKSLQPPPPVASVPPPDQSTPQKRGAYLVALGTCAQCHTPIDNQMRPRADLAFGGGFVLKGPWGEVASANLTPDPSGIPYYTDALFLQAMRTGHVQARKLNSIMPWGRYRNLTDEDITAIFAHLKTLKPVVHRVDNTEPPTPCKRCGSRHGLGSANL